MPQTAVATNAHVQAPVARAPGRIDGRSPLARGLLYRLIWTAAAALALWAGVYWALG